MMAQQQQPWYLTVIRLGGMRLMRPEMSWRPIVTVKIDQHYTHETILGVDGQNVNQKETFNFDEATFSSGLKVEVWQRSQSKKKPKKKNLVASSESFYLGELLKKQNHEQKLDIQLNCRVNNGSVSSGGEPPNGTFLRIRLRPPLHIARQQNVAESDYEDTFTDPDNSEAGTVSIPQAQHSINGCFALSPLPTRTEQVEEPPPLTRLQRIFASFTMYSKLKAANTDADFEQVFVCLKTEWTSMGGLLVALAAFDTAVFSINSGSLFTVDSHARNAIVTSSMVSGLGIACDAWFFLRYYWADLPTSIARAQDVYDTYFFFSLSARVPALCAFISAFCLMIFLSCVAFNASPYGVIVVCFIFGVMVSLQFLVFGVHWCTTRVVEGVSTSARAVVRVSGV